MKKNDIGKILLLLIILSIVVFVISFLLGSSGVSLSELIDIILNNGNHYDKIIFFKLRLPRAILAYIVGAALSVCGACLQGIFKNPMADSYLLGVSSGASLGATIAFFLGLNTIAFGISYVSIFAFIFAVLAMITVYNLARVSKKVSTFTLLLSGIAINSLCSAIVHGIMIIARDKMEHIVMWNMGSFTSASWPKVYIASFVCIIACVFTLMYSRDMNIMLQGDEAARHLGVNTQKTRFILIIITSIATATAVSVSGVIGFVGLVIPHMIRRLIGPEHKRLIITSFFAGGIFLLLCDTIARNILHNQELPVGIITAFVGVPFFLYILRKGRKII